jgi:transcriptional regulator with XRE-family HTH domain
MNFGPQNAHEAEIFAVEELRAEIQYEILRALQVANVSQSQLAQKLGCSPAAVSQFLGDEANLTIETIAKVFLALGRQVRIESAPCGEQFAPVSLGRSPTKINWQFDEQKIELGSTGDTSSDLMKIARQSASKNMPARFSNDNSEFYEQFAGSAG